MLAAPRGLRKIPSKDGSGGSHVQVSKGTGRVEGRSGGSAQGRGFAGACRAAIEGLEISDEFWDGEGDGTEVNLHPHPNQGSPNIVKDLIAAQCMDSNTRIQNQAFLSCGLFFMPARDDMKSTSESDIVDR